MYNAYCSWCIFNGQTPWRENAFSAAMSTKGYDKKKHATGMRYINVRLHDVPQRPRDDDGEDVVPA